MGSFNIIPKALIINGIIIKLGIFDIGNKWIDIGNIQDLEKANKF